MWDGTDESLPVEEFVRLAREHPRCTHLVLCTNGVVLPRRAEKLRAWVERLGAPLTIKLSVNHHLMGEDADLISLAVLLRDTLAELDGERRADRQSTTLTPWFRLYQRRSDASQRVSEMYPTASAMTANAMGPMMQCGSAALAKYRLPAGSQLAKSVHPSRDATQVAAGTINVKTIPSVLAGAPLENDQNPSAK
jgi:hypothetical protein